MLRILLLTVPIAAGAIGTGMTVEAKASVARLASADEQPATVVVVKPDEVHNAKPRKKPRMVLRCALFGQFIQGCGPG